MTKAEALRRARLILGATAEIIVNRGVPSPAERSAAREAVDRLRSELRGLRSDSGVSHADYEEAKRTKIQEFGRWSAIASRYRYDVVRPLPFGIGITVEGSGDTLEEALQSCESKMQEW